MFVWLAIFVAGCVTTKADQTYTKLQSIPPSCKVNGYGSSPPTCYTLYSGRNGAAMRWQEAFDFCRQEGGQLAVIPDGDVQRKIAGFVGVPEQGNHVWVAGRRSTEATEWMSVGGRVFTETPIYNNVPGTCTVLDTQLASRDPAKIRTKWCYGWNRKALCQTRGDSCSGFYTKGFCYEVSSANYESWFRARDYCKSLPSGDLAYVSVTDTDLLNNLGLSGEFWIGVQKQPWMWFYADGRREMLNFYEWNNHQGDGQGNQCLYLNRADQMKWETKQCDGYCRMFVCETGYKLGVPTTSIPVTPPPTSGSLPTTVNPPNTTVRTDFTFQNIFQGEYWPVGYSGSFSDESDIIIIRDGTGNVYKEDLTTGKREVILPYTIMSAIKASEFVISPDSRFILLGYDIISLYRYSFTAKYRIYDTLNGTIISFPNDQTLYDKQIQLVHWGKGNKLSFVYENNLYYQRNPYAIPVKVTTDGAKQYILNGIPDWMYEEDIIWSNSAHYWSPDGRYIAYARFDLTRIPLMKIPVYGSGYQLYPDVIEFAYPKAGDIRNGRLGPTTGVELYVYDTENPNGKPQRIFPPVELAQVDHYYTIVAWNDDTSVYIEWTNRAMNISYVVTCNVYDSIPRCLKEYQTVADNGWVMIPAPRPVFSEDFYLTILPQRAADGETWRHLAKIAIQKSGDAVPFNRPLRIDFITTGRFEVTDIVSYDRIRRVVYFMSTESDPTERHLYSVSVQSPRSTPVCLTCQGDESCLYMDIEFSPSSQYFIQACRGPGIPKYYLRMQDSRLVRVLEDNRQYDVNIAEKRLPIPFFIDVNLVQPYIGKAEIWLPPNYDPHKNYYHLHFVYGSPDSQEVVKIHHVGGYKQNWFNYLSSTYDVIISKMDGRGTYGRSDNHRYAVYRKLGVADVEDQMEFIRYFRENYRTTSKAKTAVIGWSYGGKISLLSLANNADLVECSLAISPEVNSLYYDSAYSERYLGFANESAEAYENTNVIAQAEKFRGKKLFLAHGTRDDNVHFIHYAHFTKALIDAGVQYKTYVYADENHNLGHYSTIKHLYQAMTDFLIQDCWQRR